MVAGLATLVTEVGKSGGSKEEEENSSMQFRSFMLDMSGYMHALGGSFMALTN